MGQGKNTCKCISAFIGKAQQFIYSKAEYSAWHGFTHQCVRQVLVGRTNTQHLGEQACHFLVYFLTVIHTHPSMITESAIPVYYLCFERVLFHITSFSYCSHQCIILASLQTLTLYLNFIHFISPFGSDNLDFHGFLSFLTHLLIICWSVPQLIPKSLKNSVSVNLLSSTDIDYGQENPSHGTIDNCCFTALPPHIEILGMIFQNDDKHHSQSGQVEWKSKMKQHHLPDKCSFLETYNPETGGN